MNQQIVDLIDMANAIGESQLTTVDEVVEICAEGSASEAFIIGVAAGVNSILAVFGMTGTQIGLSEPSGYAIAQLPGYELLGARARGIVDAYIAQHTLEALVATVAAGVALTHQPPTIVLLSMITNNKLD